MKTITLKNILTGFGMLAIILTLMPFVALDYWWIRMFDFPHLQLTFLTVLAILFYIIKFDFKAWRDYLFIGILIACCIFQFLKIFPYTAFAQYEVLNSEKNKPKISLFTANVLQKNREYQLLKTMYKDINADIMLFTETDSKWTNALNADMSPIFGHTIKVPKENTYGMLLYSRLELFDSEVKYLVSDSVPSIHTKLKLSTNDTIQLYAIHPTPPMPEENPTSSGRDTEMMMIAKLALDSKYPVIVIGDFNDVAWSQTSKLFQSVSRLLDVRKGRGLYNTFSADSYILRWPLDHIFISSEFKLTKVVRCDDINSDHYPLLSILSYEPEDKQLQQRPYPTKAELKRADDQIKKFNSEQLKSK
ncbi:endonuclease/exonuclease/phosphatase family protein [Winogradskyella bathintestinalis]|uniref:Endonuclease/exonuclease/phosphatase family protein n=1 Tax=Winogradskyella bathintestinalis TaxID=3035208 RepID=A0ABT7ZZ21_9FLAO|nr:endonuclease/exonuclease/phosphatase family protein [Winogradskyella bathintestinalis]MDN3494237.1 endonuclease/exonuclease/phosphatase family protein [Winogradskyella bathintestinalis]